MGTNSHGKPVLACGDIEANPGPGCVDYQLAPWLVESAIRDLGCPLPWVDAFAGPHNALFPTHWSPSDSAFRHDWRQLLPAWVNPPFHLFEAVRAKILREGAFVLLV